MSPSPIWHPFTQHGLGRPARPIVRAQGAYVYDDEGRRILDGISSWWVITHGHAHPKIVAAISEQAALLDQVIFADFTHGPAERLARGLCALLPPSLCRVFFSDSGSTSVEVALKMALGSFQARGETRTRVFALEGGYHGDTFGAMSVGSRGVYTRLYEPFLFDVDFLPCPTEEGGARTIEALERAVLAAPGVHGALILEPLVLGAGGMKMYAPEVVSALCGICRRAGILTIFDEVMTGWGRTGTRFALDQIQGCVPDLLCLAKGITGGALPLAVTVATEEIFSAFLSRDPGRQFFHSSSYTANPIACAAALANLEIWEEEPVFERLDAIARGHRRGLEALSSHPLVRGARMQGSIAAWEIVLENQGEGYLSSLSIPLRQAFLDRGILLRPLGNTVYILPPYGVGEEELEGVYGSVGEVLDSFAEVLRPSVWKKGLS